MDDELRHPRFGELERHFGPPTPSELKKLYADPIVESDIPFMRPDGTLEYIAFFLPMSLKTVHEYEKGIGPNRMAFALTSGEGVLFVEWQGSKPRTIYRYNPETRKTDILAGTLDELLSWEVDRKARLKKIEEDTLCPPQKSPTFSHFQHMLSTIPWLTQANSRRVEKVCDKALVTAGYIFAGTVIANLAGILISRSAADATFRLAAPATAILLESFLLFNAFGILFKLFVGLKDAKKPIGLYGWLFFGGFLLLALAFLNIFIQFIPPLIVRILKS